MDIRSQVIKDAQTGAIRPGRKGWVDEEVSRRLRASAAAATAAAEQERARQWRARQWREAAAAAAKGYPQYLETGSSWTTLTRWTGRVFRAEGTIITGEYARPTDPAAPAIVVVRHVVDGDVHWERFTWVPGLRSWRHKRGPDAAVPA